MSALGNGTAVSVARGTRSVALAGQREHDNGSAWRAYYDNARGKVDAAISDAARAFGAGLIRESEYAEIDAALRSQQTRLHREPAIPRQLSATRISKFAPRRYQRSPGREASRHRRRVLARDGHMPPDVRVHYTEGQCAVLTVIAGEVKRRGVCDWPIDKIAAVAGVRRTTAQNAMREAAQLHHIAVQRRPVKGRKNLTNVISIISQEWRTWIERGPGTGFKTISASKFLNSTKILDDAAAGDDDAAKKLATEICQMVGIDPLARPPGWRDAARQVQAWQTAGLTRGVILFGVRKAMLSEARKREGPPNSIAYFDNPIRQTMAVFDQNAKAADEEWAHFERRTAAARRGIR
jgi:hypothetical protein